MQIFFLLLGPLIKERPKVHEDIPVDQDIQFAVTHGYIWGNKGSECKDDGGPYTNIFTDLRNDMILNWIMGIVPDVYVIGNTIYVHSNTLLNFLSNMRILIYLYFTST